MQASFTIEGRMPDLNEYTKKNRANKYAGTAMKRRETERAAWSAKSAHVPRFRRPVWVTFHWFEPAKGRRRDLDNVAFAKKFILDGLTLAGVIVDDGPKWVAGFKDVFSYCDDPHIVVTLSEAKTW